MNKETLDDVDNNLVIARMKSMEREMYNSNDPRAELVREFMDFLTEHGVIASVTETKLELSYAREDNPLALDEAFKQGGEAFRHYCLLYGKIIKDKSWDDLIDGKPNRGYIILIDGYYAHIKMECGEVYAFGYSKEQQGLQA